MQTKYTFKRQWIKKSSGNWFDKKTYERRIWICRFSWWILKKRPPLTTKWRTLVLNKCRKPLLGLLTEFWISQNSLQLLPVDTAGQGTFAFGSLKALTRPFWGCLSSIHPQSLGGTNVARLTFLHPQKPANVARKRAYRVLDKPKLAAITSSWYGWSRHVRLRLPQGLDSAVSTSIKKSIWGWSYSYHSLLEEQIP